MDNVNLIKLHDFDKDKNQVIQFFINKTILTTEMYCDQCHSKKLFQISKTNLIKNRRVKCNSKVYLRQHFLFSYSNLECGLTMKAAKRSHFGLATIILNFR